MKISDIKTQVSNILNLKDVATEDLVCANVRNSRIDEVHPNTKSVFDIE